MNNTDPDFETRLLDARLEAAADWLKHLPKLPRNVASACVTFDYDDGRHLTIVFSYTGEEEKPTAPHTNPAKPVLIDPIHEFYGSGNWCEFPTASGKCGRMRPDPHHGVWKSA